MYIADNLDVGQVQAHRLCDVFGNGFMSHNSMYVDSLITRDNSFNKIYFNHKNQKLLTCLKKQNLIIASGPYLIFGLKNYKIKSADNAEVGLAVLDWLAKE